jgi:CRP-like cAMP-binding protein
MEELLNFLNAIYPLSDEAIKYLRTHFKTKSLAKREFLLKKGHVSREVCFINKGLLRCFYMLDDKEVSSWFMKEGDVIVGVESFFNQTISYESIQAIEDTELCYLTYNELQYSYANFTELNFIGRVLTQKYYTLSERRLYSLRMQKAPDRLRYLREYHPELILRVPSKYLASYLGIAEPTLSTIKSNS